MKVLVKDLKPNPYRKIDKYPIDRTKVESLKESINQTGFWDNILSRKENGEYQIAYGHHRLQAIKELGIEEIDIPVKEIDDATMIKIMANENMEDWKINTSVINETVQVAKEYLGKEIGKYVKKKNYKDSKLLSGIFENNVEFELYEKKRDIKAKVINRFLGLVWKHHIIYQSLQTIDGYKDHSIDREAVETFQSPRHSKVFMEEMRRKKIPAEKQKEYAEKIITKSLLEDKKEIEDISSNDIREKVYDIQVEERKKEKPELFVKSEREKPFDTLDIAYDIKQIEKYVNDMIVKKPSLSEKYHHGFNQRISNIIEKLKKLRTIGADNA